MPFTTRTGCRLYYELSGDPALPVLVLVRGLARSARYWGPLVPALTPAFRLLLLDNRGVGHSDTPGPPYSTTMMADDVAAVMDAAGIDRAHLFGMSLGGMIAQQVALAHRDRITRLVLGCTSPGGKRAAQPGLAARFELVRAGLGSIERQLAMFISDATVRARPELHDEWSTLARSEPLRLRGALGQIAAALRHDAFDRLGQITQPTLVITGDDDSVIPAANSRLIAERIPNSTLVVLAGARHDFTTDRPHETAHAIVNHLRAT